MTILNDFRQDEARVLDRLVDDELSEMDRRELLAAFDEEPGAWRHCALAFLESQNWRQQLSRLVVEPQVSLAAGGGLGETADPGRGRGAFWGACLAVAASLLVAFSLGTRFPGDRIATPATPETQLAATPLVKNTIPELSPAATESPETIADALPESAWQTVKLTLGNGSESEEIEVPVVVATSQDETWPTETESALSASLFEKLRAAGLEVVRRQRLVPVEMSDGRRLVVPVEQVDIRSPDLAQSL